MIYIVIAVVMFWVGFAFCAMFTVGKEASDKMETDQVVNKLIDAIKATYKTYYLHTDEFTLHEIKDVLEDTLIIAIGDDRYIDWINKEVYEQIKREDANE